MQFLSPILFLVATASADFIIANTTSCFGGTPVGACNTNVQVISEGADYNSSFTCDKLYHAQDHRHIHHNTAGPLGDNFTSTSDVCGVGRLFFSRNYTSSAVNGTFEIYEGTDDSGDSVGSCTYDGASDYMRRCTQLFGVIFYEGAYRCNTTVCGTDSSSSSSSSSSVTPTSTASSTSSETTTTTSTSSGSSSSGSATSGSAATSTESSSSAPTTATGTSETSSTGTITGTSSTDSTATFSSSTHIETSSITSRTSAG